MKYYQLEQTEKKADMYIFGTISSYPWREKDKDAYAVVKELQDLNVDEISVHINSTGGSVAEGLAIYNVLKNHKAKVTTYCDGFACSAASVIFMAGEKRVMNEASLLMIHNAWTYGMGNAAELRKQAEDLDIITQASVNAYVRNSTISEEEIKKMMDAETWISAEKAKEYGFATQIYEEEVNEASQSAMKAIRNIILTEPKQAELKAMEIDTDSIAQKVAEQLEKRFEKPKSAWSAFFGEKKGE